MIWIKNHVTSTMRNRYRVGFFLCWSSEDNRSKRKRSSSFDAGHNHSAHCLRSQEKKLSHNYRSMLLACLANIQFSFYTRKTRSQRQQTFMPSSVSREVFFPFRAAFYSFTYFPPSNFSDFFLLRVSDFLLLFLPHLLTFVASLWWKIFFN